MNTYCPLGSIFVAGDQLTAVRFESAQRQAANGNDAEKWTRLKFFSVDFHFLMNLADVSNLYSSCLFHLHKDSTNKQTSPQGFLKNHCKEGSVFSSMKGCLMRHLPSDAKEDMNRVEDFFEVCFQGMILALTASTHDFPLVQGFPSDRKFFPAPLADLFFSVS